MKRFFALVMALIMALSMTACGQTERYPDIADMLDSGEYENAMLAIYDLYIKNTPPTPTENPNLERKYGTLVSAVASLIHYTQNQYDLDGFRFVYFDGYEHIRFEGMDAVAWLYETALELGAYKSAADIAAHFTVLEDVALEKVYRYTDALGNWVESSRVNYIYNADGELISQSIDNGMIPDHYPCNYGTPEYTKDGSGIVTSVRYLSGDTVNCVLDYSYDADGRLTFEHYRDKDGRDYTIAYHYENGILIRAKGVPYTEGSAETMTVEYSYDDHGNLILESGTPDHWDPSGSSKFVRTVQYTYDENGRVTVVRRALECYVKTHLDDPDFTIEQCQDVREWTYTYDEAGRMSQNTYAYIGNTTPDGTPFQSAYRVYTGSIQYGSYYVYTPSSEGN